jgi:DNA-directed RNA polymerase specialized sigma subunit
MTVFVEDNFKQFAKSVEREIAKYGGVENDDVLQKDQLTRLIGLEREFRATLIANPLGESSYQDFIRFISDTKRNILAARPYFRERQEKFTAAIAPVLKAKSAVGLYPFDFNTQFVKFIMGLRKWPRKSKLPQLSEQIFTLRTEIVEMNIPLAINRARVFFGSTPKSHLERMDVVQIAFEGLLSGIDKYAPGEAIVPRQFRSTSMGRMTGNFIEEYSETALHFFPADKRKLYRANKALSKLIGIVDCELLAAQVNEGVKPDQLQQLTTPDEIADLLAAASTVSMTPTDTDPDTIGLVDRYAAPESTRPDVMVEEASANDLMVVAIQGLTIFERKVLRLHGVRFAIN